MSKENNQGKSKKFYWLKLHKDFFKRKEIMLVESMPQGINFIYFYLKLLLESVDSEGMLRFSDTIPYTAEMLAAITNTDVETVNGALKVFSDLKMIEVLEDKTLYMPEIEKMTGVASQDEHTRETTRLRVQAYRERKKQEVLEKNRYSNATVHYGSVTCNGEIRDRVKNIDDIHKCISLSETKLSDEEKTPKKPSDFEKVIEEWNKLERYGIKSVKKVTKDSQRGKQLSARLKQYTLDEILQAIENIKTSDFLQGKHSGRDWQITFDWFVKPNNFPKVLEGNYNNKVRQINAQPEYKSRQEMIDDIFGQTDTQPEYRSRQEMINDIFG